MTVGRRAVVGDPLVAPRKTNRAQKGATELIPHSTLLVRYQMDALQRDAALQRLLPVRPSLRQQLASVLRATRAAVTAPVNASTELTPALTDYPYRS